MQTREALPPVPPRLAFRAWAPAVGDREHRRRARDEPLDDTRRARTRPDRLDPRRMPLDGEHAKLSPSGWATGSYTSPPALRSRDGAPSSTSSTHAPCATELVEAFAKLKTLTSPPPADSLNRPTLARDGTAWVPQIGGRLARYYPCLTGLSFRSRVAETSLLEPNPAQVLVSGERASNPRPQAWEAHSRPLSLFV